MITQEMKNQMEPLTSRIASKEKLIVKLLHHFDQSKRRHRGLTEAAKTVLSNENPANTRKMLHTTMSILADQMDMNQDLLALLVMYASDSDFMTKQANFAVKTGYISPEDALREMFASKFRGQ
jgi:hypothetical protein